MSLSNEAELLLLKHLLSNDDWANIGDAGGLLGSSAPGVFYVSLHTADPTDTGDQTTSEATFTSYARVSVVRDGTEWVVSGNGLENGNAITYPTCTGGSSTVTHFGIGTDSTGAGHLVIYGALTASLAVSNGITAEFAAGALDITAN